MTRKEILNLNSNEYEHPFDRKALNALEQTPGLDIIIRKFSKYWTDKILKIQYTGSNIKVNEKNFPEVHNALIEACNILCVKNIPKLYIKWGYDVNAFTAGVEDPIIVLNSGTIDLLTYEELLFVIGHEVGHIKSQHVLYYQMAQILPFLGEIIGSATLGVGNLVSTGLQIAILNWARMSEFTADRAGLLTCQDSNVAATAMIKIAGVPKKYFNLIDVDDFIGQAKEFDDYDYDSMDKVAKIVSTMWIDHPWTVMRTAEFFKWIDSGEYDAILNRTNKKESKPGYNNMRFCTNCGYKIRADQVFCSNCGNKLK